MSLRLRWKSRSSARGIGLADDLVLDLVDRVADVVGEWEVAVDDVVADRPQQVVRALGQDRRHAAAQVMRGQRDPRPGRGS